MLSKFYLEIVLEKKKIEKKGRNSSRTCPLSPLGPASLWPVYSSTPDLLARPISARPTRAPFLSLCVDDERAPFLLSPPSRPRAPASPLPFPSSSPPRRELGSFLPEINPNPVISLPYSWIRTSIKASSLAALHFFPTATQIRSLGHPTALRWTSPRTKQVPHVASPPR